MDIISRLRHTLGMNTTDNLFSSAGVVTNADGSVLERLEYLQSELGHHGKNIFVDTTITTSGDGLSWATACKTMAAALLLAASSDVIYVSGKINEQCIAPLGVYGVRIVGADTSPRHDFAASWIVSSGDASKANLELLEQGWSIENMMMQSFTTSPAVKLSRGEDTAHPDPSHASFINCRFTGVDGIWDAGGCYNITIKGCKFYDLTGSAVKSVAGPNGGIAAPQHWLVEDCDFVNCLAGLVNGFKWIRVVKCMFANCTTSLNFTGGTAPNFVIDCSTDEANATFNNSNGYWGLTGDVWKMNLTDQVRHTIPTVA